jgi:hypothetical protein
MDEIARIAIRGVYGLGGLLTLITLAYLVLYLPQKWAGLYD